jgi:hypothetical protein
VKITPCTVGSLSTGGSKILIPGFFFEDSINNLFLIVRPVPPESLALDLRTSEQDLTVPRMYLIN